MPRSFLRSKVKNSEMIHFFRKLSLLMGAGASISAALDLAARSDYFKGISEKVRSGGSFSGALEADVFPPAVIGIVSVAENSGSLSTGLARACRYLEKKDSFRKKIIGALIYPAFVMLLCCASLFILMSVLLPSFAGIFQSIGVALPPISRFILDSGRFFPLMSAVIAIMLYCSIRYLFSDKGFKFPVIGKFRSKLVAASFFSSMAEALSSGMNLLDSLSLSTGLVNSALFKEKLLASNKLVSEGNALSESLNSTGLFDETAISLISAGEHSSSLDKVFAQLADLYEEETENGLKMFSSLVEPASTLATGLVVGVIVFAMFMPIIKLISVLGG
jgi:type II secretory pathway component PulF